MHRDHAHHAFIIERDEIGVLLVKTIEQTVWSGGSGASSPVWSPDGAYLAFQVSIPGATSDVLLLPLAGGRSVFLHQPDATPTSWR
jgi:Tol biopolymer transport system component